MMIPFGQFVRTKRESLKLSQQKLANACGFAHRAEISRLETGKLEWKLGQVVTVAGLFGMTAARLVEEWESVESCPACGQPGITRPTAPGFKVGAWECPHCGRGGVTY